MSLATLKKEKAHDLLHEASEYYLHLRRERKAMAKMFYELSIRIQEADDEIKRLEKRYKIKKE